MPCTCSPVSAPGAKRHSVTRTRSLSTCTVATACGSLLIGDPCRSSQVLWKISENTTYRIGRGLPQAADGGVGHHLRQIGEQVAIPMPLGHQLGGLLGAVATGRALATAL